MIVRLRDLINLILEGKEMQLEFDPSRRGSIVEHLINKNKITQRNLCKHRIRYPITNCHSKQDKSRRIKTNSKMLT